MSAHELQHMAVIADAINIVLIRFIIAGIISVKVIQKSEYCANCRNKAVVKLSRLLNVQIGRIKKCWLDSHQANTYTYVIQLHLSNFE